MQLGNCVSIDYVPNGSGTRCYWHDTEKVLNQNDAVDQYYKVNTCVDSTTGTPGTCVPEFSEVVDSRSIGGKGEDIATKDECKQFCNDETTCVGFDFVVSFAKPCFFFNDLEAMQMTNTASTGITQYRITKRCGKFPTLI